MANILEKIIAQKHLEVAENKARVPIKMLETSPFFTAPTASLRDHLLAENGIGLLAEFKRRSPSKGWINESASVEKTTVGYAAAGASAVSILTDGPFFGGSTDDLSAARRLLDLPILQKDFIVDEYQIVEARSIGASAILLLANVLNPLKIKELVALARSIELEVLLEIHDETELESLCDDIACVGVNNRNLKNFEVSVEHSFRLGERIPNSFLKVSESGLREAKNIVALREAGFRGFLIGEFFMKNSDPAQACGELVEDVKRLLF